MDISMCRGTGCKVNTNCHRCPISGTVASNWRQSFFVEVPGVDHNCGYYSPISRADMPTLEQRMLRTVEHFCGYMINKEITRKNEEPRAFKQYIADSFYDTIGPTEGELADEIIAWFKSSSVDSDDVIEVIENNLLGVICLMDTHDGGTKYIDQVVWHFDKPKPALTVIQGNRSIN